MSQAAINIKHQIENRLQNAALIGLEAFDSKGKFLEVYNPANGELLGALPTDNAASVHKAIDAAKGSLAAWNELGAYRRSEILHRWAELMENNKEDLALIITLEQGKPIKESRGEIDYALSFLHWFAEEGKRHYGETIPSHKDGARMLTIRQPIGVAAAVTPWNFPSAMITRKAGAALAAGCSMLVCPSHETPYSAVALQNLALEAGIPQGVFKVFIGDAPEIVGCFTKSETVRALSFTGSTRVGKILMQESASTMKKLSMELGGHAPFIVLQDADMNAAVQGVIDAKFATSGQDCLAVNKCYVHESLYEEFCTRVAEETKKLVVGPGTAEETDIGPLISEAAIEKSEDHIADAVQKGATVLTGGKRLHDNEWFMAPTVIRDITPDMHIHSEETFGPVLPICSFSDFKSMLADANTTTYGLAAYVYGRDIADLWAAGESLEYGMIAVNTPSMTGPPIPFGGFKQSGLGREGSRYGLDDYSEIKYMCLGSMSHS